MRFTSLSLGKSRNESDVVPAELPLFTLASTLRALSEASSELVYTTKLLMADLYKLRVLTSTEAEKECYIDVGVGSSENLRMCLRQDSRVLGGNKNTH